MATDAGLAAELADAAGALLRDIRAAGADGTRGDREANQLLLEGLAAARPGDAVLSEESPDDRTRLSRDRVWIIDPLDGTREFGLPGRDDWAVHVALWTAQYAGIGAAAVALPARRELYVSEQPVPSPGRPGGRPLRFVVSDSRPPAFAPSLGAALGAEVVPMGSAGAKAMAVLRGDADAYVHAGGQWEWDSAAPVGVALASGVHASRLDGSPLRYNQPHPYLPDLVLCQPWLAGRLLAALRDVALSGS
jgi:3'(2'), 5'-bisphosphate nucleotidase